MRLRHQGFLWRLPTAVVLLGLGVLVPCSAAFAQAPDNSKTNQRDRQNGAVTADQQAVTEQPSEELPAFRAGAILCQPGAGSFLTE